MTRRKLPHEKLKPGPKPKAPALPEQQQQAVVAQAAPVAPVAQPVAPRWDDPLQRNRPIDSMQEAELRQYGLQIGLSRRDANELGVERLRVACKQRVNDLIEEL
jgi:hypothetical protein